MKKSILTSVVAGLAVMIFTASAYAVPQRVALKTTVPNIPKSACYQAGTISLEFDALTTMVAGDVIQFTLNNGVQICKDIEFFYPVIAAVPAAPGAGDPPGDPTPAEGNQGFLVKARANSLIVTMTLGTLEDEAADDDDDNTWQGRFETDTAVAFAVPADTTYTISLFDKKIASVLLDGTVDQPILMDDPETKVKDYTVPITYGDNVICIDTLTFDYQGERVEVTPDSIVSDPVTKLTFTGEREIARILAADEYALVSCKSAPKVGRIELNEGQGDDCPPFDFNNGLNYCPNTHSNNVVIIQALTNPFPVNNYQISLEVKVNGLTGDQGVYIAESEMQYATAEVLDDKNPSTTDDACSTGGKDLDFDTYVAPGACSESTDVEPGGSGCTVDCENKVVKATTEITDLGITRDDPKSFLRLWLPSFRYDSSIVEEGDVVSVRLVVSQYPCGTIVDEEIQIGTFGCEEAAPKGSTLLYPYFTPANGSYFWSAYAITNLSDAEGTVTLYMYESDGDAFQGVVGTPVPAHSIWATRVDDSIVNPDITWTPLATAGSGTPGDAMLYIRAVTTFDADGFGFIAGSPTGESMGYLPRRDGCCD